MAAEILLHFSKLWKKGGQKGEGGGGSWQIKHFPHLHHLYNSADGRTMEG